jgi:hypothetical protein
MNINSITGNVASFQMQSLQPTGSMDKSVKGVPATNDPPSIKAGQVSPLDAITDSKISTSNMKVTAKSIVTSSQPAGIVSHVVESYNQYGKVRTKFMDSRNNVVYQTPSEMVAKIEDQMNTPNTSANVKG